MKWLERVRTYYILKKYGLPDDLWFKTTKKLPLLASLTTSEMVSLRVLSTLLIYRKSFYGAHQFDVTLEMKIIIAAQACVEILQLGIESFDGWEEIVVYPGAFKVERQVQDEFGLVSNEQNVLSGEAWGKVHSYCLGMMLKEIAIICGLVITLLSMSLRISWIC